MGKRCETFDHTADVGLDARADTLEELLEALAHGLAGVIHDPAGVQGRETRALRLEADDLETLTVDFLWSVKDLIEADLFLVHEVRVLRAGEREVAAEIDGEPYDEARHTFVGEVKAVTYHQLEVGQAPGGGWRARVILDL